MSTALSNSAPPVSRRTYRPREVAAMTGMSKTKVLHLVRDGDLASVRVGDCILIRADSLDALLGERPR